MVNTLDKTGAAQFVHSGTYKELTKGFGLDAKSLRKKVISILDGGANGR
jgi:transketolase C-terminal domain/subunit